MLAVAEDRARLCTLTNAGENTVLLPAASVTVTLPQGGVLKAPLKMDHFFVGTAPDCDLIVADVRVSRRHCELRLTQRGVILRDLKSKNGTLIGEIPVFEAILPIGAIATIGSSHLSVSVEGEPSVVPLSPTGQFGEAIGQSVAMRALFARIERAARTPETILLLGESGTGKEVLAKAIHAASPRKTGPFVVFDCSAVAPNLIEGELFGYVRGAFTGAVAAHEGLLEQARGGTLFIDELGELPLDLQPKLLRALEARQVRRVGSKEWRSFDVRVVAATHRNLRTRIAEGLFREDLYYRLAVVEVRVPSLRERKDDIPLLVQRFLSLTSPHRALAELSPHTLELLMAHDWPGNVRELRNVVARLVLFPELADEALGGLLAPRLERPPEASRTADPGGAPADDSGLGAILHLPIREAREAIVEQFERRYIEAKLREHGGNVSHTADAVGLSRQHLHRLMVGYAIRGRP
jgi:DNA-binding NtrC family response regulator